jgi:8-oxo-dGTP pyrophosphatase MutT (NUDIX family)
MNHPNITYSAGGIITNGSDRVILICENGNFWGLPKGRIEKGEDALTAAIREIREEAGIERLKLIKSLGSYGRHPFTTDNKEDKSELKIIQMYLFRSDQVAMQPLEANLTAVWLHIKDAATMLTHPADKGFFLSVKDQIPTNYLRHY